MKKLFTFYLSLCTFVSLAQNATIDSLQQALKNYTASKAELKIASPSLYDTTAVNIIFSFCNFYRANNPDKTLDYANQALSLSEQIGFKKGIAKAYFTMSAVTYSTGDYLSGLEYANKSLKIAEEIGDKKGIASSHNTLGLLYIELGNYSEA